MLVRDAIPGDLLRILSIYNHAATNTTAVWTDGASDIVERRSWFDARSRSGFPVLVAEASREVIGFASFTDFRPWPGYRYTVENSIYVDPSFDRRGAAREASNEASLALHRGEDFMESGRIPEIGCKFGRWLDLIFLSKKLDNRVEPGDAISK